MASRLARRAHTNTIGTCGLALTCQCALMKIDHVDSSGTVSAETFTTTAEDSSRVALMMRSRSAAELAASSTPSTAHTATDSSVRDSTASEPSDSAAELTRATFRRRRSWQCAAKWFVTATFPAV